jgi:RNA polymerase sigma-70 factor (ECF subfamily)
MEADEFDAFYTVSFIRLVSQVHAMIGDRDEAQDCVQEAFVRAWSNRGRLDSSGSPEAWVRTTAYRLAVSRWRRVVLSRRAPDRALQAVAEHPPPDEARVVLMRALSQPTPDQRHALVLHHLCDLPVAEIARVVNAPVGTVKARLSRGRTTLQSLLAEEGASHV